MKKRILSILLMALFPTVLFSCGNENSQQNEKMNTLCEDIDVPEIKFIAHRTILSEVAQEMMTGDVVILDVRSRSEFESGHIANSILLPLDDINEHANSVVLNKTQTILIYCRTGRRSATAAALMAEMGFINVYDFGGIMDWPGEIVTVN